MQSNIALLLSSIKHSHKYLHGFFPSQFSVQTCSDLGCDNNWNFVSQQWNHPSVQSLISCVCSKSTTWPFAPQLNTLRYFRNSSFMKCLSLKMTFLRLGNYHTKPWSVLRVFTIWYVYAAIVVEVISRCTFDSKENEIYVDNWCEPMIDQVVSMVSIKPWSVQVQVFLSIK